VQYPPPRPPYCLQYCAIYFPHDSLYCNKILAISCKGLVRVRAKQTNYVVTTHYTGAAASSRRVVAKSSDRHAQVQGVASSYGSGVEPRAHQEQGGRQSSLAQSSAPDRVGDEREVVGQGPSAVGRNTGWNPSLSAGRKPHMSGSGNELKLLRRKHDAEHDRIVQALAEDKAEREERKAQQALAKQPAPSAAASG